MGSLLSLVIMVVSLGSLICAIIVVIQLFKEKGPLHGILGIICGLYTFIWGWLNAARLNIRNIMMIWTALVVVLIVLQVLAGVLGAGRAAFPQ